MRALSLLPQLPHIMLTNLPARRRLRPSIPSQPLSVRISSRLFLIQADTVSADHPHYQTAGAAGERTLWVVFVIMLVATIVFSGLSWNVPVVSARLRC